MILGEGTNVALLQSIMPKPPNVRTIYPLINGRGVKDIYLPEPFTNSSEVIHIFVLEPDNPQDALYDNEVAVKEMVERLYQYTKVTRTSGRKCIVFWPKNCEMFTEYRDQLRARQVEFPQTLIFIEWENWEYRLVGINETALLSYWSTCS